MIKLNNPNDKKPEGRVVKLQIDTQNWSLHDASSGMEEHQRLSLTERGSVYFKTDNGLEKRALRKIRNKITPEFARQLLDIAAEVLPIVKPETDFCCDGAMYEAALTYENGVRTYVKYGSSKQKEKFHALLEHFTGIESLFEFIEVKNGLEPWFDQI